MKKECIQCKTTDYWTSHSIYDKESDSIILFCDDCFKGVSKTPEVTVSTKEESRALHWKEIQTRVRTHEGELLTGKAGMQYQKNHSKTMLGKDLGSSSRADRWMVENFQKQQNAKRN